MKEYLRPSEQAFAKHDEDDGRGEKLQDATVLRCPPLTEGRRVGRLANDRERQAKTIAKIPMIVE